MSDTAKLNEVKEIAAAYGTGRDYLYVKNTDDGKLYRLSDKFVIDNLSRSELCAVLGSANVKEQSNE